MTTATKESYNTIYKHVATEEGPLPTDKEAPPHDVARPERKGQRKTIQE